VSSFPNAAADIAIAVHKRSLGEFFCFAGCGRKLALWVTFSVPRTYGQ
jgi:hypothetical protein